MKRLWLTTLGLYGIAFLIYLFHRYYLISLLPLQEEAYVEFSYLYNAIFSVLLIGLLWGIGLVMKDFLGFLLVFFGVFKIILFVYLASELDYTLFRKDFLTIFIPYAMGQGIEIYFVSKVLNPAKA